MEKERKKKAVKTESRRTEWWLQSDIVVKVVTKKLAGGKYHKKKGVVLKVLEKYVAELKMVDSGHKLRVDQEMLETVIPKAGGVVRVLQGEHRGRTAVLEVLNTDRFTASLRLEGALPSQAGSGDARRIELPYEDISKAA